jgi:Stress up-regulated Nod 19
MTSKINGEIVCTSHAIYGGFKSDRNHTDEGTLNDMTYCNPKEGIKVKKGDTVLLEAHYDLEQHPP